MIAVLFMSLFFIIYGALGCIKGIQKIPQKFKNTEYENPYKKFQGRVYLTLGISYFFIWIMMANKIIAFETIQIACILFTVPILLYAIIGHLIFCKRLKKANQ